MRRFMTVLLVMAVYAVSHLSAAAAPDSKKAPTLVGKRVMINLGFEPEFLAEIDAQCARRGGISRPALIRLALSRLFESGV